MTKAIGNVAVAVKCNSTVAWPPDKAAKSIPSGPVLISPDVGKGLHRRIQCHNPQFLINDRTGTDRLGRLFRLEIGKDVPRMALERR